MPATIILGRKTHLKNPESKKKATFHLDEKVLFSAGWQTNKTNREISHLQEKEKKKKGAYEQEEWVSPWGSNGKMIQTGVILVLNVRSRVSRPEQKSDKIKTTIILLRWSRKWDYFQ